MPGALQPVSVEGVEFDALISSNEALEASVPAYPVESGYETSDTIISKQLRLDLVLYVSEHPVTWNKRFGGGAGRIRQVEDKLKKLYYEKKLITVVTTDRTYQNMAISSVAFTKTAEIGYAREIPLSLVQVMVTNTKTCTIPDSYGKSGTTGVAAGAASVTDSTETTPGTEKSTGEGSSEENGKSGSLLYAAASALGFME